MSGARPTPHAVVAVGSADFDHVLRATLAEAYLRMIRMGAHPDVARDAAARTGAQTVLRHNSKCPSDVNWQRDAGSESAFLDRVDAIIRRAWAAP